MFHIVCIIFRLKFFLLQKIRVINSIMETKVGVILYVLFHTTNRNYSAVVRRDSFGLASL